jgi:hypothetical protein
MSMISNASIFASSWEEAEPVVVTELMIVSDATGPSYFCLVKTLRRLTEAQQGTIPA